MQGTIFDIKHYAIHDGPGIRTTVFLKGCPLGCWWCHNPESRAKEIIVFDKVETLNGQVVEKSETVGKFYTVAEVLAEVEKDIMLYEESGGGVTFSGGEPLFQFDFLLANLKACKQKEINTCVDTTGFTEETKIKQAAAFTDLFLYDLKHIDDTAHKKVTGVSNQKILSNLKLLDKMDKTINIRYPLIPGINDDEADLFRLMSFLNSLKNRHEVSILPYHKIGSQKYGRFRLEYKMDGIEEPSEKHIENIKNIFEDGGFVTSVGG